MPRPISSQNYNSVAKFLHWLISFAIIAMLAIGWTMTSLPKTDPLKFSLFQWHKSIGITILLLSVFRLIWRLMNPPPPLPTDMPRWEKIAAKATHWLFYVLIIGMPLTGWVIVSASPLNIPTVLYGVIPWPHLPVIPTLPNKKDIGGAFGTLHGYLAWLMAGLLVLHVAAAWKHHLINRDDVLTRMAPGFMVGLLNRIRGRSRILPAIIIMVLMASPAFAKPWTVDYKNSRLGFTGMQGDTSFDGSFKIFQANIDFDPAHPESSKITATIDTGSATAGSAERDTYLPQADWFNTSKFPQAQFASTAIRAAGTDKSGANCFEADGNLTIKGISKPVKLPFCLKPEGDHMRAQGTLKLLRTDFKVGEGQWSSEAYVKYGVDVTVDIAAKAN